MTQSMCGAVFRDRAHEYNIISCTLLAVACCVVMIRLLYKKICSPSLLGLDDLFISLTMIISIPSIVINVKMLTANGLGKDIWTLTPTTITTFSKGFYTIAVLYFSEVFLLKLSILFFYLRIFPGNGVRRLLTLTILFDVLFGFAFVLTAVFQCQPISYNWNNWRSEGGGRCLNVNAIAWANAAVSIALDIWMLAIPLSQIRGLQLDWQKKVEATCMFCIGTL